MKNETQFVVCLNNKGYLASLEIGKLYQIVPDAEAEKLGCFQVIDEDGEDYLYGAKMFCPLRVPPIVSQILLAIGK